MLLDIDLDAHETRKGRGRRGRPPVFEDDQHVVKRGEIGSCARGKKGRGENKKAKRLLFLPPLPSISMASVHGEEQMRSEEIVP